METNAQGQVAMKYRATTPHAFKVNGTGYVFTVRAHICMAWIQPEHVEIVKGLRHKSCHCSNPRIHPDYVLCSADDVRRWTVGGGR